ncbi:RagB/SusD family nutrient uptake outer membrane protein [Leeuwenhoekiella marinoflava]|uniref:RagB/SusD family nutrient uptake outer membrane protein n=1 Tax=Leeuwenhoekiella marinoflava TaxID=988 RepID=UPI0030025A59
MKLNIKTKFRSKTAFVLLTAATLGITLNSCNEGNVLDLEPYNSISENAAFSTADLVKLSVTGLYNAAEIGIYTGAGRGYPFGAAFVQQGDNRGEDVVNVATFYQLTYTATYDPTTANNVYYWSDTYRLINRANIIIEGVQGALDNGIITSDIAADYIAQAKFFRAAGHLELLFHFARPYNDTPDAGHPGVPYRDFAIQTAESLALAEAQGRNTVAECYQRIIQDLNDAEDDLLSKADRATEEGSTRGGIVRATKEAAIAFKTRAYLHMRNWPMVITEGVKLNTAYTLPTDPNTTFSSGYDNTESVFSMEHSENNNPGVNAALASQYNRRGLVVVSPIIWRNPAWLADDERRTEGGLISTTSGVIYTNKYKDATNYTDPAPVLRYAEVLLNMAEAYARATPSNTTAALAALNQVRNRSLADPATQAYVSSDFATPAALVNAIITERRIEFVMEGRRWPDIHRLQNDNLAPVNGIPAKVANGTPAAAAYTLGTAYDGPLGVDAVPYSDFRFVWPIPQQETNNNPTLAAQQNPGW